MLTLLTWNETLYFLIDFWALYGRPYCKVGSFFRFFHLLPFAGNRRTTILPTTSVTWSLYNAHWLRWNQNCLTDLLRFKYRRFVSANFQPIIIMVGWKLSNVWSYTFWFFTTPSLADTFKYSDPWSSEQRCVFQVPFPVNLFLPF